MKGGAGRDAARAEARREKAAAEARQAEEARQRGEAGDRQVRVLHPGNRPGGQIPVTYLPMVSQTPEASAIEVAARQRARGYFENEKRTGSGQTLVFGVRVETDKPVEIPGWPNRWSVEGTAGYKVYDAIGWGSFSTRSKKFRATVEAAPGEKVKVVDFTER